MKSIGLKSSDEGGLGMHLLFDIDGTVIDHEMRIYGLYRQYAMDHDYPVISKTAYFAKKKEGISEKSIAAGTFPRAAVTPYTVWKKTVIETPEALLLDRLVSGIRDGLAKLVPFHTLASLSARQSKEALEEELVRLEIRAYFQSVLRVGIANPAQAKAAAIIAYKNVHRCSLEDIIVIGDTEVDILASRVAGVRCIAVGWGLRSASFLVGQGARTIVKFVRDLPKVIGQ